MHTPCHAYWNKCLKSAIYKLFSTFLYDSTKQKAFKFWITQLNYLKGRYTESRIYERLPENHFCIFHAASCWKMFEALIFILEAHFPVLEKLDLSIFVLGEEICVHKPSEGRTKRAPILRCATIKISLKLKLEDWFIFYVFTFTCILFKRFDGAKTDIWLHLPKISLQSMAKSFIGFLLSQKYCSSSRREQWIMKTGDDGIHLKLVSIRAIRWLRKYRRMFVIRWTRIKRTNILR